MIAQLDLFAAPAPPSPVRPAAAPAPVPLSANGGTAAATVNFSDDGTAAVIDDPMPAWRRARREGREIVEVDPARVQSRFDGGKPGDVRASYSAQSLCEDNRVSAPFRLRGHEWVQTGGLYCNEGNEFECYRIVPLEAFDGEAVPYSEWDWDKNRNRAIGGYHGMRARHGSREVVLVGPPIVIVEGKPDQAALL